MNAVRPQIYVYSSARAFVLDTACFFEKSQPEFSIRRWAKVMGLGSHALLTMILQGKRRLTLKQAPHFAKGLELAAAEMLYFQLLIQSDLAENEDEKRLLGQWMSDLCPPASRVKELDNYHLISDWIYPALLALLELPDFAGGAEEAARLMPPSTTVHQIRAAFERLKSLGIIELTDAGRWRVLYDRITTANDRPNLAVRAYHQQAARLAVDAVEQQAPDQREFQSFAMPIDRGHLGEAKRLIRKLRDDLEKLSGAGRPDLVYQANLHFFRLTESPSSAPGLKADEGAGVINPSPPEKPHETPRSH